MRPTHPMRILLTVLAYISATFAVQALSHFVVNVEHYKSITIMRAQPVFALGIASMLIQGTIFALLFPAFNRSGSPIRNAILFSWAFGLFLASYIALAEPAKYKISSIATWSGVEALAAAIQFTFFGVLLGLIHQGSQSAGLSATSERTAG